MSSPQSSLPEDVGSVVLETAVLKFLSTAEPDEKIAFTEFIEQNQNSDTLLVDLSEAYPRFGTLLENEIEAMQTDIASLPGTPAE
jgi:hypothetical protein